MIVLTLYVYREFTPKSTVVDPTMLRNVFFTKTLLGTISGDARFYVQPCHDAHPTQGYARLLKSNNLNDSVNSPYFTLPTGRKHRVRHHRHEGIFDAALKTALKLEMEELSKNELVLKRLQCS